MRFAHVLFLTLTVFTSASRADSGQARAALRNVGLVERNGRWELAEEQLLRRRLSQLEERHVKILAARRTLQSIIIENGTRWGQIGRRVQGLERRLKSLGTDSKQRKSVESQLASLRNTAVAPDQLGSSPRVRVLVKALLTWELESTVKCQWSRKTLNRIRETYPRLKADPEVTKHLQALNVSLGDAQAFRDADETLSRCDDQLMSAKSSMYSEAGLWRVGVIINERSPATVSWIAKGEHILLAPSLAASAKLIVDPQRQPRRLQVAKKRTAQVRPVIIEQLRMGSVVIEDVPAWVLPADAEDLGTRLGEYAVEQWRVQPQPADLHATVHRVRQ